MSPLDVLGRRGEPGPPGDETPEALQDMPDAMPSGLVTVVHDCVPGRVRWRVAGLRRDPALKTMLETALAELPDVHTASASVETGNLLILFDPVLCAAQIRERIAALMREDIAFSSDGTAAAPDWHACPAEEVVATLQTSGTHGLAEADAGKRLAEYGINVLPEPSPRSTMAIFLAQFQTLPVGLLAVVGGVSLLTGAVVEAAAILAVVVANSLLGTAVESRSEHTIRSLGTLTGQEPVPVMRDAAWKAVLPEMLVPGDMIELQPGMVVPADARVIRARDLRVSEGMLTGESLPVAKQVAPVGHGTVLGDRTSMVFRGTAVTGGSGAAVVTATGPRTEMGRIQRLVNGEATPKTLMQRQLDTLGRQVVWASLAACAAVMGLGALRGIAMTQLLWSGVSLAVAAVPEGLPAVATTTLALGIEAMRKRGVVVRRLDAVEALASVSVVCFDKTGTLTLNQMRVVELASGGQRVRTGPDGILLDADGQALDLEAGRNESLAWLLRIGALCSDADLAHGSDGRVAPTGSATESALIRLALGAGLDVARLREEYPCLAVRRRSEGYRFMATAHRRGSAAAGAAVVAVKGSPAEVLELCARDLHDGLRQPLTAQRRAAILRANDAMAADALRVLGFAFGEVPDAALDAGDGAAVPVTGLTWVGLAGLADPVRPGMDTLMRTLHGAGLRTVMMTGDQVATAHAVARQLSLAEGNTVRVVDAAAIEDLTGQELAAAARGAHVFARVSPAQKLRLIRAMQEAGERVAMTGDGINDSPALKAADVGLAMGGTASSAAARDVADMVLQTDNLATLPIAVERGRATYVNVRKSIHYLLATNLSEILVVLGATAVGLGQPLTGMQLLWINLVSDVLPGIGLAFEPPEPGLMQREAFAADGEIIGRSNLGQLGIEGGLLAAGSLAAFGWGALRHGAASPQARTMAFGSLVTGQLLHTLTVRSDRHGLFTGAPGALAPNRPLRGLLLASAGLQALGLLVPGIRAALGVAPLGLLDLVTTAAAGVLPYIANEALKAGRSAPMTPLPIGTNNGAYGASHPAIPDIAMES
ncbi:MAG: HAD-IC family P-type ATPase [Rhodopila sp.]